MLRNLKQAVLVLSASFEQMAMKRGVRLLGETPVDMPLIRCDRDRVLQVIANLLSSALKIVNQGGSVYLRVKQRENEAVFSVADNVPGIALAEHARLFESYWRSPQASYQGIGSLSKLWGTPGAENSAIDQPIATGARLDSLQFRCSPCKCWKP